MLKLLTTMALCLHGLATNAQTRFEAAKLSYGRGVPISEGIDADWEIDLQTAFRLGDFGLQLDANYFNITNPLLTADELSGAIHITKDIQNDLTLGTFVGYSSTNLPINGLSNFSFGVEAMKQFGALHAQASWSMVYNADFIFVGRPLQILAIDIDYQLAPQVFIGAKNSFLLSPYSSTKSDTEIYATYEVNDTFALTAYYKQTVSGLNNGLAGLSASIEFGTGNRNSLFSPRQFELLSILFR